MVPNDPPRGSAAASCRAPPPYTGPRPARYDAGLPVLEILVSELESGQLPLDKLVGTNQGGPALLAFCREKLQAVEDQIKVLDAGSLKPWTAE